MSYDNALYNDYTLLMQLCARGNLPEIEKLWRVDATFEVNLNKPAGWNKATALIVAAHAGHGEIVQFLLAKGANAKMKNLLGCNALMVAAEEGHVDIVKMLHEHDKQLIDGETNFQQTALMLAIESDDSPEQVQSNTKSKEGPVSVVQSTITDGEVSAGVLSTANRSTRSDITDSKFMQIIKYIIEQDPSQLDRRNMFDKWPFMIGCEFGKAAFVKWMLDLKDVKVKNMDINERNNRGNTCLMMACTGDPSDKRVITVVELLLQHRADVNIKNKKNETALMFAAVPNKLHNNKRQLGHRDSNSHRNGADLQVHSRPGDDTSIFKALINVADLTVIDEVNDDGFTALMKASELGLEGVCKLLIDKGAKINIENEKKNNMTALHFAFMNGHIDLATKYFVVDNNIRQAKASSVFTKEQMVEMAEIYSTVRKGSMEHLGRYAAVYDFHFDLMVNLIPLCPFCITMLNNTLPSFFYTLHRGLKDNDSVKSTYVDLTYKLIQLSAAITKAVRNHPLEKVDLEERLDRVKKMLIEVFKCDSMDDESHVHNSLCCALHPSKRVYADSTVERAHAFQVGPLQAALQSYVTALFASANVSTFVDKIFWTFLKKKHYPKSFLGLTEWVYSLYDRSSGTAAKKKDDKHQSLLSKESQNIVKLRSKLINLRYCPALMFLADGLSHLSMLFLICWMTLVLYNPESGDLDYEGTSRTTLLLPEGFLIVMCFAAILYEIGELVGNSVVPHPWHNSRSYFNNVWNYFDIGAILCILTWLALKFDVEYPFLYCRVALAAASIFQAAGLLRYSSMNASLGEFVIVIIGMIADLGAFLIVFVVGIAGFWVFFWSLYQDNDRFESPSVSFLTLFTASLGNYYAMGTIFAHEGSLSDVGMLVFFVYVVFAAVVLFNLIIARMTSTHNKITKRSFQEW